MKTYQNIYVGGRWLPAEQPAAPIPVVNPTTEEVVAQVPSGSAGDVDRAVDAARDAFREWSTTPAADRAAALRRVHEGLLARRAEIATLVSTEVGMPFQQSLGWQADLPIENFGIFADLAASYAYRAGRVRHSEVISEPVGVVGAITPWNYPLHQIALKVAPAMAAGCTVVLKPSEVAPQTAFLLAEVIDAAGLPAGVFNLVSGTGTPVGESIAGHPGIDMVSFTGSTAAGCRVSELAAPTVKRVALELGGKSANVILDDADLEKAVTDGVGNCFFNAGQTCTALTRMLVPRSLAKEAEAIAARVAKGFVTGDPFDESTTLGPVVSARQLKRVRALIGAGVAEGARLLTGGTDPVSSRGYFVAPTVFGGVGAEMAIARQEIFGPVLSILPYDSDEGAVALANDSDYGLAGGVWSGDEERALRVARELRAGQISVNGGGFNIEAPFGGYKRSGIGREAGRWGLEEYLEVKAIHR